MWSTLDTVAAISLMAAAACFAEERPVNRRAIEASQAYRASPFSELSLDYFARFKRDQNINAADDEVVIGDDWHILLPANASPLAELMAGHLQEFFRQNMELNLAIDKLDPDVRLDNIENAVTLLENGVDLDDAANECFRITARLNCIRIEGRGFRMALLGCPCLVHW